jgi:hypothetical protein
MLKRSVFWNITPCSFGKATDGAQQRVLSIFRVDEKAEFCLPPAFTLVSLLTTCFHAGFLLGSFLYPENGGDIFLRNDVYFSADYTALYPRRQISSTYFLFGRQY